MVIQNPPPQGVRVRVPVSAPPGNQVVSPLVALFGDWIGPWPKRARGHAMNIPGRLDATHTGFAVAPSTIPQSTVPSLRGFAT